MQNLAGGESIDVMVTPYHKPCAIRQILNALESNEVEKIRNSPFGKLVEIADKASFSGRFGRYIISRQLKVAKKHEAWFFFAGKPVRFSLREFAFRFFFFFAYPWGRMSFDVLMRIIKERKEVSLSQSTTALKGFVLSLQLVMVEAVHALTEVVQDGSSSGSEDEFGEEEDNIDDNGEKKSISPGHASDTDAAGKVGIVHSIIFGRENPVNAAMEFEWYDDEEESSVDNLLKLIQQNYPLREEVKAEGLHRKTTKAKHDIFTQISVGFDAEFMADVVKDKLKEDFTRIEIQLATYEGLNLKC
ncbi:hypothetical protein N665_0028s0032 [Sinapis alba]|nr:hypothetical protein N665_0028s0032 [Sinapis alba]